MTTELETRWLPRLRAKLLGYDVFLSHRRSDGAVFAANLAESLKGIGVTPFRDVAEIPAGEPLPESLRRALRRSRLLVVVGSPDAMVRRKEHDWVWDEIEVHREVHGRPPIVICIPGAGTAPWSTEDRAYRLPELTKAWQTNIPSASTVEGIGAAVGFRRANRIGVALLAGAAALLVGLMVVGATQWNAKRLTTRHKDGLARSADAWAWANHTPDVSKVALAQAVNGYSRYPNPLSESVLRLAERQMPALVADRRGEPLTNRAPIAWGRGRVAVGHEAEVHLWNLAPPSAAEPEHRIQLQAKRLFMSADGCLLLVITDDGELRAFRRLDGAWEDFALRTPVALPPKDIVDAAILSDPRLIVAAETRRILVWDSDSPTAKATWEAPEQAKDFEAVQVALLAGTPSIVARTGARLCLWQGWDDADETTHSSVELDRHVSAMTMHEDYIAVASMDGVYLYDSTLTISETLPCARPTRLLLTADRLYAFAGRSTMALHGFDLHRIGGRVRGVLAQIIAPFFPPTEPSTWVCVDDDIAVSGDRAAIIGGNGVIREGVGIVNSKTGTPILRIPQSSVVSVSRDGPTWHTLSEDGSIRSWRIDPPRTWLSLPREVTALGTRMQFSTARCAPMPFLAGGASAGSSLMTIASEVIPGATRERNPSRTAVSIWPSHGTPKHHVMPGSALAAHVGDRRSHALVLTTDGLFRVPIQTEGGPIKARPSIPMSDLAPFRQSAAQFSSDGMFLVTAGNDRIRVLRGPDWTSICSAVVTEPDRGSVLVHGPAIHFVNATTAVTFHGDTAWRIRTDPPTIERLPIPKWCTRLHPGIDCIVATTTDGSTSRIAVLSVETGEATAEWSVPFRVRSAAHDGRSVWMAGPMGLRRWAMDSPTDASQTAATPFELDTAELTQAWLCLSPDAETLWVVRHDRITAIDTDTDRVLARAKRKLAVLPD